MPDQRSINPTLLIKAFSLRVWNSPTITTWASFATRALGIVMILPMVLNRFSPAEVTVWYLLMTFMGMQMLVDMGFTPSFSRLIAYATAGAHTLAPPPGGRTAQLAATGPGITSPNWDLMERICSTMSTTYNRLALALFLGLATVGSLLLIKPVAFLQSRQEGWYAWAAVLLGSTAIIWGNRYHAFLQGTNQIALLRRWEAITALLGTCAMLAVLMARGGLLALAGVTQASLLVNILRNRHLSRNSLEGRYARFARRGLDREVMAIAWPSTWRSGIGIAMSYGIVQASGIIYSQFAPPVASASYLLSLRLMDMLTKISNAPFYTKLPYLAQLYSRSDTSRIVSIAKTGMARSFWTYTVGFLFLLFVAGPVLLKAGSSVAYPPPLMLGLLGVGFLLERFGAMHLQLYSTSNHIVWHVANGITGIICISVGVALARPLGTMAFPVALVIGYAGFYSWYSERLSRRLFRFNGLDFHSKTVLIPAVAMVAAIVARALL